MANKKKRNRRERGQGSFRYFDNGRVEYRISYTDEIGDSFKKSFTAGSEQECLERAYEWIKRHEKVENGVDAESSIVDILKNRFEIDYKMNYINESGYGRKIESLKILERSHIGNVPIYKLQKRHIEDYLGSITHYSNSVIEKIFLQLKLAFAIAYEKGLIERNIMLSRDIRRPRSDKPDKKVRALTLEEQKILVDALSNKRYNYGSNDYHLQLFIELYSGMRMGEINALRSKDIDFDNNVIHVRGTVSLGIDHKPFLKGSTKTYAGLRDVPISDKLRPYLQEAIDNYKPNPQGLLFFNRRTKGVLATNMVNSSFQRLCKDVGLPKTGQHCLRHTFATRCIESGVPPVVLKTWLGHKDIHVTLDTYTDVFKTMDNEAMDKVNKYLTKI